MTTNSFDPSLTLLLQRWSNGDTGSLEKAWPLLYDELRRLAGRHLRHERPGHTLQDTGLVHEAFLRLPKQGKFEWESRAQFFGLASTLMRRILVDHARARRAAKRGGGELFTSLGEPDDADLGLPAMDHHQSDAALDIAALDQSLQRLEQLDTMQSRVVELRFFGGLSTEEIAATLNISPSTVKREWASARAWLLRDLGGTAALATSRPARSKA